MCILGHLPTIISHPIDATLLLYNGTESATFTCEANGTNIQYSWFNKTDDGNMMIVGEMSNELVLSPITVEMNNTRYYCVAKNNSGSVNSTSGHLTINSKHNYRILQIVRGGKVSWFSWISW